MSSVHGCSVFDVIRYGHTKHDDGFYDKKATKTTQYKHGTIKRIVAIGSYRPGRVVLPFYIII